MFDALDAESAASFDGSLGDAVCQEDESFAGVELALDWFEFRCLLAGAEGGVRWAFQLAEVAFDVYEVGGGVSAVDPRQRRGRGVPACHEGGHVEVGAVELAHGLVYQGQRLHEVAVSAARGA